MKAVTGLGDRLLARLVPKARAAAVVCYPQYVCKYVESSKCPKNAVQFSRLSCTNGSTSPWRNVGCCS